MERTLLVTSMWMDTLNGQVQRRYASIGCIDGKGTLLQCDWRRELAIGLPASSNNLLDTY